MKLSTGIIFLVIFAGIVFLVYRRYVYFPHATVTSAGAQAITWSNGRIQTSIRTDCAGDTAGSYNRNYEYYVQCLPNKQFRFVVHKKGNPELRVIDNIFSFTYPPEFLTK